MEYQGIVYSVSGSGGCRPPEPESVYHVEEGA